MIAVFIIQAHFTDRMCTHIHNARTHTHIQAHACVHIHTYMHTQMHYGNLFLHKLIHKFSYFIFMKTYPDLMFRSLFFLTVFQALGYRLQTRPQGNNALVLIHCLYTVNVLFSEGPSVVQATV